MTQLQTLEGWYALHEFKRFDWGKWRTLSASDQSDVLEQSLQVFSEYDRAKSGGEGTWALYDICGHKADFLFLNLRSSLEALTSSERLLQKSPLGAFLLADYSYVSVVELSNYVVKHGESPLDDPKVRARLYPAIPDFKNICFYPMNKKRDGQDNWYSLDETQRRQMMRSHGMTGRKYAGQVTQMISGSVGLDDWEWGVTLFADDPIVFKKLVYEMRFDEVSARFGEFGRFLVGTRLTPHSFYDCLKATT